MSLGVTLKVPGMVTIYSDNITHNLTQMANAAGIYEHLWRPDELGIKTAVQLIAPLTDGLMKLLADPDKFRKYDPKNGWGSYDGLCDFVAAYIEACKDHPEAIVEACR